MMSPIRKDIDARLRELRFLVEHARSMPMSASVVVNREDLLGRLEALESTLEDTLSTATQVVGDADAVVAESRSQAQEILRQAHADREKLVSDTDVYQLAQQRAEEMTTSARREVDELRRETDEYVEQRLANFELTLERTLEAVRRGRARLMGGHVHALADDTDVDGIALPDHLRRD
jgi:cell division septum initiation protein DivIVA